MPNRRYNTQVANPMKTGGRVAKRGGGMSTARKDMASGYYKDDMDDIERSRSKNY